MYETLIQPEQLHANLGHPDWLIVDCRYDLADTTAGYRQYLAGHIPGAVYAHLHDDLSGPPVTDHGRHPLPDPQRLERLFSDLGVGTGVQVAAYDDSSGSIAGRLWWMLHYMGHRAAAVLDGGWAAWVECGFEVEEKEIRRNPLSFRGAAQRDRLVTLPEVPELRLLVDSREPARYRGEREPLDPAAGHIPGARNRWWRQNLDARGRFLPPAELRRQFESMYGSADPGDATFYCGSGVSACHNVLAAAHSGLPVPRLYVGSWSEWSADPSRPVATGNEGGGYAGCSSGS